MSESENVAAPPSPGPAQARVLRAEVTSEPVKPDLLAAAVEDPAAGAVVTFTGMVRNHDGGHAVTAITYTAHPSANEVLGAIAAEVAARPGLRTIGVVHRIGELRVGETALAVAVSADHRAAAFAAASDVVEEIKRRLPIWKQQTFADGSRAWSNTP
ncbi:molybdenum cofactor biosynthesis protein MoaE [Actinomyces sp. MRS3W]|uniref:molybdenum cofactor biosynthesis protein MoaE n=1 Tax=Actinomyces sp. MRS3W TaxID=2800796 RepID=UPI0028FD892F|nr:molybdenum cofactor biosynthesis protein MoaE [Actinomyces sp. MRS3W]MDU0349114.1 molybdenum cofactor biosynthesis protein MoaE [Actinomyces sp. MRS3W]